jgi:hypothetical protein
MADIYNILISVLCPTSNSASYCRDFLNAPHHQTLAPVGPLFYFLLFPTVFIILFIYWLSGRVIKEHKGINLLIGVSFFVFIIISGWYPFALWISEIWYIAVIILLGLWVLFSKLLKGDSGGGTATKMPGLGSSTGSGLTKRAWNTISGKMKSLEKTIDINLDELEMLKQRIESGDTRAWDAYPSARTACTKAIAEYEEAVSVGGIKIGGHLESKINRLQKIIDEFDHKRG